MNDYTITYNNDNFNNGKSFNMVITDNFIKDLEQIVENLSIGIISDMSIISNMELFNTILYRKAVSTFIKYLKENIDYISNTTYKLNIIHKDEIYSLFIRNNSINTKEEIYKGIQGITYGPTINK